MSLLLAQIKKKGFISKVGGLPVIIVSITAAAIIAVAVSFLLLKKQRKGKDNFVFIL